jgi:hypothetical protein
MIILACTLEVWGNVVSSSLVSLCSTLGGRPSKLRLTPYGLILSPRGRPHKGMGILPLLYLGEVIGHGLEELCHLF